MLNFDIKKEQCPKHICHFRNELGGIYFNDN